MGKNHLSKIFHIDKPSNRRCSELGKQLHDRATRGEFLTAEERVQLEAWYSEQDRNEMNDLGLTPPAKDVALLQAQIDAMIARLTILTQRIQKTAQENATLRSEIVDLQRQLAQQTSP